MPEQMVQELPGEKRRSSQLRNRQRPFSLKKAQLRQFLKELGENGRAEETIKKYRSDLNRFYEFLGEEKWVFPDSLTRWRSSMIADGYAPRSINASLAAVNSFYDSIGCWEWQCTDWMELKESGTPELSREEYLQLLQEARKQENIQLYLLVKVLACTELTPSEIPLLTREAVNEGVVTGKKRGGQENVSLPEPLQRDLLNFAVHRSIRSGPVFLNGSRKCLTRTVISKQIGTLGEDIGLEAGKANPRNLRRLYLSTLGEYEKQAQAWVRESYLRQLSGEEDSIGWRIRIPEQARKEA